MFIPNLIEYMRKNSDYRIEFHCPTIVVKKNGRFCAYIEKLWNEIIIYWINPEKKEYFELERLISDFLGKNHGFKVVQKEMIR
ncbi:MAG: hypothetical protein ACE5K4_08500 [Candidatus Hydrothermarchaeota archaeon]